MKFRYPNHYITPVAYSVWAAGLKVGEVSNRTAQEWRTHCAFCETCVAVSKTRKDAVEYIWDHWKACFHDNSDL